MNLTRNGQSSGGAMRRPSKKAGNSVGMSFFAISKK